MFFFLTYKELKWYPKEEMRCGSSMSIGKRIKEARRAKGLSQVQLAEKIGVSKGAVGNYETGFSHPQFDILCAIFEELEIDANYIFQDFIQNKYKSTVLSKETQEVVNAYENSKKDVKNCVRRVLGLYDLLDNIPHEQNEKIHNKIKEYEKELIIEAKSGGKSSPSEALGIEEAV